MCAESVNLLTLCLAVVTTWFGRGVWSQVAQYSSTASWSQSSYSWSSFLDFTACETLLGIEIEQWCRIRFTAACWAHDSRERHKAETCIPNLYYTFCARQHRFPCIFQPRNMRKALRIDLSVVILTLQPITPWCILSSEFNKCFMIYYIQIWITLGSLYINWPVAHWVVHHCTSLVSIDDQFRWCLINLGGLSNPNGHVPSKLWPILRCWLGTLHCNLIGAVHWVHEVVHKLYESLCFLPLSRCGHACWVTPNIIAWMIGMLIGTPFSCNVQIWISILLMFCLEMCNDQHLLAEEEGLGLINIWGCPRSCNH